MISRTEAQKLISDSISILGITNKDVLDCLDYVLAEDLVSKLDLPPFDKSAMDGYAVADNESADELEVIETVQAGQLPKNKIIAGKSIKIMTGAPIPKNTGKVIMKENVQALDSSNIKIINRSHKTNICYKGEDVKKGQIIYRQGKTINPIALANIISSGISKVKVYRKPSVGIIVTGDELLEPGSTYTAGKIYNSNGPLLQNVLLKNGINEVNSYMADDNIKGLSSTLKTALAENDLVVMTGGISVGEFDFTKTVLEQIGAKEIFHKIDIKPGKPVAFFKYQDKPIFALPGNPVSVYLSFYLFVLPAIHRMRNFLPEFEIIKTQLKKDIHIKKPSSREHFLPVIFDGEHIDFPEYHGSGHLFALDECNAFLVVPNNCSVLRNKMIVDVLIS
ncbi:molybdopterin molybdotransferase MoeA [Candidatus Margulisiibacteriota bacterium]